MKKVLWFGGAYLFLALAAGGYFVLTGTFTSRGHEADAKTVARGAAVYRQYCAHCHGANLEGQPGWEKRRPDGTVPAPPQDASGHTWQHSDSALFDMVKWGGGNYVRPGERSGMPGFVDDLSDADIWAVLAFIKSRWPQKIRDDQARVTLMGGAGHH